MFGLEKNKELFWIEKESNFIKLSFSITLEEEDHLVNINDLYKQIASEIDEKQYNIYSVNFIDKDIIFSKIDFLKENKSNILIMIPKNSLNGIDLLMSKFNLSARDVKDAYKQYKYNLLNEIVSFAPEIVIISHNLLMQETMFKNCPVNPKYLIVYSIDIYSTDAEKFQRITLS